RMGEVSLRSGGLDAAQALFTQILELPETTSVDRFWAGRGLTEVALWAWDFDRALHLLDQVPLPQKGVAFQAVVAEMRGIILGKLLDLGQAAESLESANKLWTSA